VLDIESFYPTKERFSLVMALNNLLASPGFNAWMEGEPLSYLIYENAIWHEEEHAEDIVNWRNALADETDEVDEDIQE
jgi:hypothetical protein